MIELAGCVIRNQKNEILLLHRNTASLQQWELPGGKIEPGENPEVAALRELKEELAVEVKLGDKLGKASFIEGEKEWLYHWYEAVLIEEPRIGEPKKFDLLRYWSIDELKKRSDLSPNMNNLIKQKVIG